MNLEKLTTFNAPEQSADSGQYTYAGLNRLIHERARLGILTALNNQAEGLLFVDLKRLCDLTDGNLSRHLTMLQEAGLIEIWKASVDKKSQTLCKLSDTGHKQLAEYLDVLKQVLTDNSSQKM